MCFYHFAESGSGSGSDSEQERPRSASNASGSGSDSERDRDDDDDDYEGQEAGKPSINKVDYHSDGRDSYVIHRQTQAVKNAALTSTVTSEN